MPRRGIVAGALALSGLLGSACIYDFDIPGDTGDDDPAHACKPNETCSIDCAGGSCGPTCGANSTCRVSCGGGSCRSYCGPNATCTIDCAGGSCQTTCDGKCSINCGGGSCRCEGRGCP
ncbi:MAG: hypothetical protein U0270_23945 [Labilithrix sp.]